MTIQEMKQSLLEFIRDSDEKGCYQLCTKLEEAIIQNGVKDSNPEAFKEVSRIIFEGYVFAIPKLSKDRFFRIIELNTLQALSVSWKTNDVNLIERIEERYFLYDDFAKEYIVRDILPILKKNQQMVGKTSLDISTEKKGASPTIQNWLDYYDRQTGLGVTSNFDRSRFLSNDDIVATLTSPQKSLLRDVLSFYDYLRSDSLEYGKFADLSEEPTEDTNQQKLFQPTSQQQEHSVSPKKSSPNQPLVLKAPKPIKPNNTIDLKNLNS